MARVDPGLAFPINLATGGENASKLPDAESDRSPREQSIVERNRPLKIIKR